ncbi:type III pantothenate kinase [Mongoliitalea daihaiensis]|uniref:type III pantothenate kinase n=1 Tax=Mongoliitalea daihaiensis TaxID=2782006 RepID=UPI001F1EB30C|nr:type III pantothenate kinase [Mongoliitalea daihaiensis]UJP66376.1 type III pantothenate kinase [Mongoliitalea daihaiensis]
MKQLIVDIGNSRIKTGKFEGTELLEEVVFSDLKGLKSYAEQLSIDAAIISSVRYDEATLQEELGFPFHYLNVHSKVPFTNNYGTPHTLGVDRKAALAGARAFFEDKPVLVIDLGSCITYDVLDASDTFSGGSISPGLSMRFQAMHQQTARLPLTNLSKGSLPHLSGESTLACMQSGVYYGILHEMEGFIRQYSMRYPDLNVIICGGDSFFFETLTKDHIFVIPNLVLYGLNRILLDNVAL